MSKELLMSVIAMLITFIIYSFFVIRVMIKKIKEGER